MTKEELIKEAWDFIWNRLNETAKQCALKNNGYVSGILANELCQPFTEWNEELKAWRPKSLQDIETNNGWIKINGQHNLPDIDTDYWVVYNGEVTKRAFNHHLPRSVAFWTDNITHYQPIEKPKPPLY